MVIIVDDPMNPRLLDTSPAEIQGLLDRRNYVVVDENDVPPGATILKSGIIHSIKKFQGASKNLWPDLSFKAS